MSYTKQNFIKGQILKADHLNAMENGIEANDLAINQFSEEINTLHTAVNNANQAADGVQGEISSLKDDVSYKISKFYASNLSATHLADSDNGYIHDMRIYGRCVQDGTPTPDAPVEIRSVVNPMVTVRGKNLLNVNGIVYQISSTNINIDDVTTTITVDSHTQYFGFKVYLEKGTYTLSNNGDRYVTLNRMTNNNGIVYGEIYSLSDGPYKIDWLNDGYYYFGCEIDASKTDKTDVPLGDDTLEVFMLQLESGTMATEYEPYNEQSVTLPYTLHAIPVTSGGNYTDESGQQWVADYVDVERGKLVRHVGEVDLGTLSWTAGSDGYGKLIFATTLNEIKDYTNSVTLVGFTTITNILIDWNRINWTEAHGLQDKTVIASYNKMVAIRDLSYADVDAFKRAMQGAKMLYENETPTETDLTPSEIAALRQLQTYYPTTNLSVTSDKLDGNTLLNYPISMANGWNYVKQQLGDTRNYIYDMDIQAAESYVNSAYAVALLELGV